MNNVNRIWEQHRALLFKSNVGSLISSPFWYVNGCNTIPWCPSQPCVPVKCYHWNIMGIGEQEWLFKNTEHEVHISVDMCDPGQLTDSRACVPDTNIKGKAASSDLVLREARFLGWSRQQSSNKTTVTTRKRWTSNKQKITDLNQWYTFVQQTKKSSLQLTAKGIPTVRCPSAEPKFQVSPQPA